MNPLTDESLADLSQRLRYGALCPVSGPGDALAADMLEAAQVIDDLAALTKRHHEGAHKMMEQAMKNGERANALRIALTALVERVELAGGLGEYAGGEPWALKRAKKTLTGAG